MTALIFGKLKDLGSRREKERSFQGGREGRKTANLKFTKTAKSRKTTAKKNRNAKAITAMS